MNVRTIRSLGFEAAHRLPEVPPGHQCERLHDHSFRFEMIVEGPVDAKMGCFIDSSAIDDVWAPLYNQLDHHYFNDVEGLENPTSAILCDRLGKPLQPQLSCLSQVIVHKTCNASCQYEGN